MFASILVHVCVRIHSCSSVCTCAFASILIVVCASIYFDSILVHVCACVCSIPFLF